MYKITDIISLGNTYSVEDATGTVVTHIQIIPQQDILSAALGEFDESFGNYSNYLEKSAELFSGNEDLKFTDILWYATVDEEVSLSDIIQIAVSGDYKVVILEYLENIE